MNSVPQPGIPNNRKESGDIKTRVEGTLVGITHGSTQVHTKATNKYTADLSAILLLLYYQLLLLSVGQPPLRVYRYGFAQGGIGLIRAHEMRTPHLFLNTRQEG